MDINLNSLLNQHKNKALNAGILILALMIAVNIYKGQTKNIASIREKNSEAIKINKVVQEISHLETKADTFKKMINKKDVSLIVNALRNLANEAGIKIDNFKPETERGYPSYVRYPFTLGIGAKNYHNLGKFISKLENSADIYWVDGLEITFRPSAQEGADKLTAQLRISTILIKD